MCIALVASCSPPEPIPIDYGNAQCVACKMVVSDTRFGAELVAKTGKTFVFDSPECLFGWYQSAKVLPVADVHSLWVTDHAHPATLIDAAKSFYLHSEELQSPMSMNVAAFAIEADLKNGLARYGGEQLSYQQVMDMAKDY